jgi:hypothetical protein
MDCVLAQIAINCMHGFARNARWQLAATPPQRGDTIQYDVVSGLVAAAVADLPQELRQVPVRAPAVGYGSPRLPLPRRGARRHRPRRCGLHAPPPLLGRPAAVRARRRAHAGAHPLRHEPRGRALVRVLRNRDGRHAARRALQGRVPPAMRHEACDRWVGQYARLVAPLHHHPAGAVRIGRRHRVVVVALAAVLPQDQEERPLHLHHGVGDLRDLVLAHNRRAAEGDVHHRLGRLGVQPAEVPALVMVKDVTRRTRGAPAVIRFVQEREHGPDGEDVHVWPQRRERVGLHGVAGVGEHVRRVLRGAVVSFQRVDELAELREHERERVVLGGDGEERRQVADAERREAREPHLGARVPGRRGGHDGVPVPAEVVVVRGERGGRLDPEHGRRRHAVVPRHARHPRQEQRVHGARDGAPVVAEAAEDPGQRARPRHPCLLHVPRVAVYGDVEPTVVAVRVGHVLDLRIAVATLLLRHSHTGSAREHLPERRERGADGDACPGARAAEAAREVTRRGDVPLRRVRDDQEVVLLVVLRRHAV